MDTSSLLCESDLKAVRVIKGMRGGRKKNGKEKRRQDEPLMIKNKRRNPDQMRTFCLMVLGY